MWTCIRNESHTDSSLFLVLFFFFSFFPSSSLLSTSTRFIFVKSCVLANVNFEICNFLPLLLCACVEVHNITRPQMMCIHHICMCIFFQEIGIVFSHFSVKSDFFQENTEKNWVNTNIKPDFFTDGYTHFLHHANQLGFGFNSNFNLFPFLFCSSNHSIIRVH